MSQEAGTHSQSVGPTVRCASRFGSIPAGIYTRGSIWPDKDAVIEDHNATLQRLAPPVRIDKIGPFLGRAEGLSADRPDLEIGPSSKRHACGSSAGNRRHLPLRGPRKVKRASLSRLTDGASNDRFRVDVECMGVEWVWVRVQ